MPKLDEQAQRARREHILDAAERCFAREGFHRTSMQDICREAGISPGALYIYFTSKEDLIAGICEREKTTFGYALASIADSADFMGALAKVAEAHCLNEPSEKLRLQVEIDAEALRNPAVGEIVRGIDAFVVENFARVVTEAKAKGRIDPQIEPALLAQIVSIIGAGVDTRRALDPNFNAEACLPVILSLLSSMIRPVETSNAASKLEMKDDHETVG
ncbi:MAG: TetR/AcrR family transcriptional regulator [Rhodomicrobium sp.]|nr:TetR/AcrR family transcriptional regulator [Rhodomicrobium sp.]